MKPTTKYIRLFVGVIMIAIGSVALKAQIYDGVSQSNTFRVWAGISQPYKGGDASASSYFGYKFTASEWFDITGLARYNFSSGSFLPAIWLNFNIDNRYYILSRSVFDCKEKRYRQSAAATVKLPLNFMIDATWDNIYNGHSWCSGDRLQFVAGMNIVKIRTIFNVGYSCRSYKGFVGTARYRFNNNLWCQVKADFGIDALDLSLAYNFD